MLPNGGVYLASNPLYYNGDVSDSPKMRDPLTVATSIDGTMFDKVGVVMSCTSLGGNSTCFPRMNGKAKNRGPSYPQGLTVVPPAPAQHQGLWIVATNNKEDVWLAKIPFKNLLFKNNL